MKRLLLHNKLLQDTMSVVPQVGCPLGCYGLGHSRRLRCDCLAVTERWCRRAQAYGGRNIHTH
eukprot:6453367-Pyramimonas_sp.AAC.1